MNTVDALREAADGKIEVGYVDIPTWRELSWLRFGSSTRLGGVSTVYGGNSLNLGWTKEDDPAHVARNRGGFVEAVMGEPSPLVTVRQVHSSNMHVIRSGSQGLETPEGRAVLEGDGLLTDQPGIVLGIQTADCVPVTLVDPEHRAVAVLHAGWRGTVAAIAERGVARMQREFGTRPESLLAAVGPSIGPCCYTVGEEVREAFAARFSYGEELFHESRLDLWEANRRQLEDAGVLPKRITALALCTGCALIGAGQRQFFSHRIDRGVTGRMMTCVGICR